MGNWISVLPYPRQVHHQEARLAMSVDREYQLHRIRRRHWAGLAVRCDLDAEPAVERVTEVVEAVPAAAARAAETVREEGLEHRIIDTLVAGIREQAERCLRVLSSVILAALLLGSSADAHAQIVTGRVVEHDSDRPIVAATIGVFDDDESIASTESDSTGFFRLVLPLSGEYRIRVERLGYSPAETEAIEVGRTEIVEVEISLRVDAVEIEPIMVVTRRTMAPTSELHRRLEEGRRTGFGQFITREQLDSTTAISVTDLVLRVPFVGMGADTLGRSTPVMFSRGGCVPTLYLNGALWNFDWGSLDAMLLPTYLEGVEIYRSRSELPADLRGCGAIVLWTREGEPTRGGFWRFILAGGAALGVLLVFIAR
jgi:hypothetical protein